MILCISGLFEIKVEGIGGRSLRNNPHRAALKRL